MSALHDPQPAIYGLMAEFPTAETLVKAAHQVHEAGFQKVDAYSPYPIEAISEALALPRSKVPILVLIGGLLGGLGGYMLQYWSQVIRYPMNVGGRPVHSWPSFIVPTFECTILGAALTAVIGMILLNGLPLPYHPVFNVPRFALASRDRFFLVIEAVDPKFDPDATRSFLAGLNASEVSAVEH